MCKNQKEYTYIFLPFVPKQKISYPREATDLIIFVCASLIFLAINVYPPFSAFSIQILNRKDWEVA